MKINSKRNLTPNIYEMKFTAKNIAQNALPGQFLIVQANEKSERIPLTIANADKKSGEITIVVMEIGESTKDLVNADEIYHAAGPLGQASDLVSMSEDELKNMRVVFLAAGVGASPVYPQAKFLHDKGIECDVILAARNKDLIIYEDELKSVSQVHIATDDGSRGFKGVITDALTDLINNGRDFDRIVAIGPMIMMKFATIRAKELNIPIIVSLNPIMVDGTGMCGCCRCSVDGKTKFACVDGPEFRGEDVDWDDALRRLKRW